MERARPAGETATRQVKIELSLRSVFSIVAIVIGLWLLIQLWQVILVVVVALIMAGTFSPVVVALEKRRVRRSLALTLVAVALIAGAVGLGFMVIPALVGQINDIITRAPEIQQQLADAAAMAPGVGERLAREIRDAHPERYVEPMGNLALSYAGAALEFVGYAVTTIMLAFYIIADRERVQGFLYAMLPRRFHVRTARIMLDLETIVGGYVRGQALTSLLIAVFTFTLLTLVGVPNALALAVLAGFTDLIPYVGGILATGPAVLAALPLGIVPAIIVWAAMSIYQEFESRVIIPRVYERTMRVSPVAVTIAFLVGGKLLGVIGVLLALPIAAGIRVVVEDLRIELPGEQAGEPTQRAIDERAEAVYNQHAEGSSAVEAAMIANAVAERLQQIEEDATGAAETPVEERGDVTIALHAEPSPGDDARPANLPNPAR